MIDELKGKKIKISIAFRQQVTIETTVYHEGIIKNCAGFAGEYFVIFEDNFMINAKYIQTIEIIG